MGKIRYNQLYLKKKGIEVIDYYLQQEKDTIKHKNNLFDFDTDDGIYKFFDYIFKQKISNIVLLHIFKLIRKLKHKDNKRISSYFKNMIRLNSDRMNINLKYKRSLQFLHYKSNTNYETGKSRIKVSEKKIRKLVNTFHGTGRMLDKNHEYVNFGCVIGKFFKQEDGKLYNTTCAKIHYSKNGYHIVPAEPEGEKNE